MTDDEPIKIKSFTDLKAWQEGHKLVLQIYKTTKKFPSSETFGLISQMQRCVVSVTSNIAEGFTRQSKKEKIQFFYTALASLTELQNQLIISRDLKLLPLNEFTTLANQSILVQKLIHGLVKYLKREK